MKSIAGKFFNRSQLDSGRGDYEEGSVAKFSDYDSNENIVGEGRNYRGGFGYKTKMLLFASMLTCLLGACRTTPTSTAYRQSFGNAVIGETVGRLINPNAYKPEQRESAQLTPEQRISPISGPRELISHGEVTGSMKLSKRQEEPMFFNAAKENPDGSYSDVRDIFYPGEEIYVVAKIPYGGKITNFGLALDKNEQIPNDLVNGAPGVEIVFKGYLTQKGLAFGAFDASENLKKYGKHHRTYWLVNDKIIGYRDFVIMDERPKVYSSK